ncbi:hypothetical protein T439DRAFT_323456 [Meredithblackwellia eburnea MCA 4105]
MAPRTVRSASGDSPLDHSDDDESPQASTSSKRGSGSKDQQDQRKVQNRIAQREFRQRKQQYIKDLEARVQLNESTRDDQVNKLRAGMRALLDENQQLRELLASLATFIGNGIGTVLPQIGIEHPEFQSLITRKRTSFVIDTINQVEPTDSIIHSSSANGHASGSGFASKRNSLSGGGDASVPPPKRARTNDLGESPQHNELASSAAASMYNLPSVGEGAFSISSAVALSNMYQQQTPVTSAGLSAGTAPVAADEGPAARKKREEEIFNSVKPPMTDAELESNEDTIQELFSMPTDNPKLQAIQLISYHMRNKREQPQYHLPPSLKATVTQQTVPHSPFFDGIIFSSLRDRLILLKDQYDLRTLLNDLVEAVDIHEDDILLPSNWELSESFLRKYWWGPSFFFPLLFLCNAVEFMH